jgi:hypothetical protein
MTTLSWDDHALLELDREGGYTRRMIAHVFNTVGSEWCVRFYVAVNGQYRFTGFETEQDAKNMAIILWRVNNDT